MKTKAYKAKHRQYIKRFAKRAMIPQINYTLAQLILPQLIRFREAELHSFPLAFANDDSHKGMEEWKQTLDEMIFGFEYIVCHHDNSFWLKNYSETPWDEAEKNKHLSYEYDRSFEVYFRESFEKTAWIEEMGEESEFVVTWEEATSISCNNERFLSWKESITYLYDSMRFVSFDEKLSDEVCAEKGYTFHQIVTTYRNESLERQASQRATKAYELFGKFFMDLWD